MNVEKEVLELRLEIAKLASRVYDGRDLEPDRPRNELKGKTPRQIMQMISRGEIQNQFVGRKNYEVLKQEGFSLKNRMKPQTWTPQEANDWSTEYLKWQEEIKQLNNQDLARLHSEIEKMLKGDTP